MLPRSYSSASGSPRLADVTAFTGFIRHFLLFALLFTVVTAWSGAARPAFAQEDPPEEVYYDYFGDFGISWVPTVTAIWLGGGENDHDMGYWENGVYGVTPTTGDLATGGGYINGSNTEASIAAVLNLHAEPVYNSASGTWTGTITTGLSSVTGYPQWTIIGPAIAPYASYDVDVEVEAEDGGRISVSGGAFGYSEGTVLSDWGGTDFLSGGGDGMTGYFTWSNTSYCNNYEDHRRTHTRTLTYDATLGMMKGSLVIPLSATVTARAISSDHQDSVGVASSYAQSGVIIKSISYHP